MRTKLTPLFLVFFSLLSLISSGQNQIFKGIVSDSKGNALEGVTIKVVASKAFTTTNKNGSFSITANTNDVIEFSSIGFETKRQVAVSASMNIILTAITSDLQDVILVGTRGAGRVKTESPVPVDVIKLTDVGLNTARMDLTSTLNFVAPSFNYNKQSGADGADHVDIGTLRGLGPDQTLVLINGKRRHSTALVGLFGTRGRGGSGVDLNGFPMSAVDRIEILRDGASAQYGSDAIAGVMNIVLRKNTNEWNITSGLAGYYDKKYNTYQFKNNHDYLYSGPIDGVTKSISANRGFDIGKKGGFINLSFDALDQGKTFRQAASSNIEDKDGLPTNTWRQGFGDGSMNSIGAMFNMEVPLGDNIKFYAFGSANSKKSDAYAYTRNWSARPTRFPVNPNGSLIFVPSIMFASGSGDTSYNPHIQANIQDVSIVTGFSKTSDRGWDWDLSNAFGNNNFHYFGDGTFNASNIGNVSQTHFDDGGFNFLQNTSNLDISKQFGKVNNGGVKVSYGGELRFEEYSIFKGEINSYKAFTNTYGLEQAPGSQGFPGFSPDDKVKANRIVTGAYSDIEITPSEMFLITGAVRAENYSDFGSVATFKTSARLKLSNNFNLRGSFSTGYRAPSLQQKYFSNTLTSFSNGGLVQSRVANNDDPITRLAGIPKLKQETSTNMSVGFTWKPAKGLTFTLDGYSIKMKDRVVLSGLFSASDASLPAELTSKLNGLGVSTAQFFANAVNTTNTGVDFVADYQKKISTTERFKFLFVANIQNITIDAINVPAALSTTEYNANTFFNDREKYFLKASAPKSKFSMSFDYTKNKVSIGTRLTYFGSLALTGFGYNGDGINPEVPSDANENIMLPEIFNYSGKIATDLYLNVQLNKKTSLILGADNILNVHPDFAVNPLAKYWAGDNETGGPWDGVQMGYNGMRIFSKLVFKF
ncbi:MAG: TonB-dependent receptor [Chitinophagia bacterium]|jgi:iron complex outermembrane receptor protein|nr:TonB-dependent receptor [Chitinophagia bacterium]NCA30064.1 TonB-dependent receptor [Chitinophagia bacterium]NDD16118.1 TonB-dependent receptor [Chitinophagia bacterium]